MQFRQNGIPHWRHAHFVAGGGAQPWPPEHRRIICEDCWEDKDSVPKASRICEIRKSFFNPDMHSFFKGVFCEQMGHTMYCLSLEVSMICLRQEAQNVCPQDNSLGSVNGSKQIWQVSRSSKPAPPGEYSDLVLPDIIYARQGTQAARKYEYLNLFVNW